MYEFGSQKDFENWINQIPLKIRKLLNRLDGDVDIKSSNYELDSVRVLSEWVLENITSVEDLQNDPILWDELSCYVGEVYRRMLKSEWSIELDSENKNDVYYRMPVIVCDPPPNVCPMYSLTTMVARKNSLFIVESIGKRLRNRS